MIYKIEKLTPNSYKLNETVTIIIDENSEEEYLKADYDEKILTESEVNSMIDAFMKMIARTLDVTDSVKVADGTSK
jgi:hypothetical protein